MERRSCIFFTNFFLFLIFTLPYFSRGGPRHEGLDSEIFEIDYRGPETHSFVPPPDHSLGDDHSKRIAAAAKTMGLKGSDLIMEQKDNKVHG